MANLAQIFWELFKISLFVIGGGYSILAVAEQVFARKGWIAEGELLDHLPVFQMVPGLIATHTAVYIGRKRGGRLGALVGVVAVALPAVAIFMLVSAGYRALPLEHPRVMAGGVGLRAALTGIIAATIVRSWRRFLTDRVAYALFLLGGLLLASDRVPVVGVLLGALVFGICRAAATGRRPGTRAYRSVLWPLLLFAEYGAICFGGGFVLVPFYLQDFVGPAAPYLQLSVSEFSDVMALSQMTPGPIGVNCATFFGYRLAGIGGAVAASALLLLPGSVLSYFVLSSLERFRSNRWVQGLLGGIRPVSVALMCVALVAFARFTLWTADGTCHPGGGVLILMTAFLTHRRLLHPIGVIFVSVALAVALDCAACL